MTTETTHPPAHHCLRCKWRVENPELWPNNCPQCGRRLPTFELGMVVITPAAESTLEHLGVEAIALVKRHHAGDWGKLDSSDYQQNDDAIHLDTLARDDYNRISQAEAQTRMLAGGNERDRVLSNYEFRIDHSIIAVWLITEWDRSVTTILLPSDY